MEELEDGAAVSIREQVRLKLVGQGTDPWGDRVLELEGARTSTDLPSPIATGQASALPFVIVRLGPQTVGQYWGDAGDSIDVWPYSEDVTWVDLDVLCGLVLLRLDKQILTDDGVNYQLNYGGVSTQDTPVAEWDAYTRPLRFDSVKTPSTTPGATHPLAVAFNEWTAVQFPGADIWWQVTDSPRVRTEAEHLNIWLDEMRSTLIGHIVTTHPQTVVTYLDRLAAILPRASIRYANTFLATIEPTRADPEADPHVEGQISVDVAYGALHGNYWASVPGQPGQPWLPTDPEHPWIRYPVEPEPGVAIPLEHAEVRDGTLVGVAPEGDLPRHPLSGAGAGVATASGQVSTQP